MKLRYMQVDINLKLGVDNSKQSVCQWRSQINRRQIHRTDQNIQQLCKWKLS